MLLLGVLVAGPVLTVPQITNRLGARFETFTNLSDDGSFIARVDMYQNAWLRTLTNPVGIGVGSIGTAQKMKVGKTRNFDSGLLVIPYEFGWPGALLILFGLGMLVLSAWRTQRRSGDVIASISTAIVLSTLALLVFKNSLTGASGAVFWCFIGLAVASLRYHLQQEALDEEVV